MTPRATRFFSSLFIGLALLIGFTSNLLAQTPNTGVFHAQVIHSTLFVGSDIRTTSDRQTGKPPQKARDLLQVIQDRQGETPPGYIGGRVFQNRERRLPKGQYREYDVNPKQAGRTRGAERIVIEQRTGKAYYTRDHYRTFAPLN